MSKREKSKEFISSDSESGSDGEPPKPKKKKSEKKEKAPKDNDSKSQEPKKGPGGELMFQIAPMRFATVSEFRGKILVSIREYYDKDGELRPGKKGISLNMEQWNSLKDHMDDINEAIKKF